VTDPLLDHPRALVEKAARVLGGTSVERPNLSGFVSSEADPFLNQLFARRRVTREQAADALAGRPGFVWLDEEPPVDGDVLVMRGMVATLSEESPPPAAEQAVEVETERELGDWHAVYSDVLGSGPSSRDDWSRLQAALGPAGDRSLVLVAARVDGTAAACGAAFFDGGIVGLYCFATRPELRGRGLASSLVHAAHKAARVRGIDRAVLQATPSGAPVYARCSYRDERSLPVLRFAAE
jgi:GNAT superfamily N-acetyltransferase